MKKPMRPRRPNRSQFQRVLVPSGAVAPVAFVGGGAA